MPIHQTRHRDIALLKPAVTVITAVTRKRRLLCALKAITKPPSLYFLPRLYENASASFEWELCVLQRKYRTQYSHQKKIARATIF